MASEVLDAIKATGYHNSTIAAITVSIADMTIPPKKYELVHQSEQMVVDIENQYKMGFMTDHERYKQVVQVWEKTTDEVSTALHMTHMGNTSLPEALVRQALRCGLSKT